MSDDQLIEYINQRIAYLLCTTSVDTLIQSHIDGMEMGYRDVLRYLRSQR